MKSQITTERIALLHPKVIDLFTGFINDAETETGLTFLCVQGLRTFAQQQALYNQGRTTAGNIVTKAKAGQSYHNYGLAIDIVPYNYDGVTLNWEYNFSHLMPMATKYDITWGGFFPSPDRDHFENKFGYDWQQLLAKYNAGDFIEGTTFVNLQSPNKI